MILTETKPTYFLDNRLTQIHEDTKRLDAFTTKLKTKRQQLTQLFDRASDALKTISELMALVPQTSTEIRAALEAIFQQDNCPIPEAKPLQEVEQPIPSHPLIEVAHQLLPILKQGKAITNTIVSRLMSETFGGSDAEGYWLWKDAYEALEAAQVMLIQQQGQELLDKSAHSDALGEIERIHRLCPTHSKRSETSIQLQQFSTPLPLGYIASIAAQITPDDLVLEPSAGTGILTSFAKASGAELLLNEICPKPSGNLKRPLPKHTCIGFQRRTD